MGYTHYFTKQKNPTWAQWHGFTEAFQLVRSKAQARALISSQALPPIQYESDDTSPPQIDDIFVRFNGVGQDGHETFMLRVDGPTGFDCCKTALKPYDLWAVVALTLLNHFAPDCWEISSDGGAGNWADGVNLVQQVFPNVENPILDLVDEE